MLRKRPQLSNTTKIIIIRSRSLGGRGVVGSGGGCDNKQLILVVSILRLIIWSKFHSHAEKCQIQHRVKKDYSNPRIPFLREVLFMTLGKNGIQYFWYFVNEYKGYVRSYLIQKQ